MKIYDTEEEQVVAIKRWWKENGFSTIVGIATGILIITGGNYWQQQQKDKSMQVSALFDELLVSINEEKQDSVKKITERIQEYDSSSTYVTLSRLLLAKTKVQMADLNGAQGILEKLVIDASSVELRNIARIRLIKVLQAKGENQRGLQLIAEADQADAEGFSASYDEMTGDLYVALDRLGEARTAYQSALRAGGKSALLQLKLDDITQAKMIESNTNVELIKE
ncbi:MAG: tetratricopeptide repeat protein [Methylococcales symbiont of Hymedesmia sp. n. MRB-2018]|nr:MAG: tetratricopeptide repeat protein [Methylococcales symbiont of Hymedesmia sp. n. MRB-2018]KAF3984115.1 MAG: tetratricopeptide repeat protein [Methylococcales symbiont of Hymedesmia sp. n. MRB-2018]